MKTKGTTNMILKLEEYWLSFGNFTVLGFFTLADIEVVLRIILLVITIIFTLWTWRRKSKEKSQGGKNVKK